MENIDKKGGTVDQHWSKILEPYLKKFFEEEEESNIQIGSKILILKYIQKFWEIRFKFISANIIGIIIVILLILLFAKPYYDAQIIILPDYGSNSKGNNFSGLAALAGVSIAEGSNAIDVYNSLLTSETVIAPVVNAKYFSSEYLDSINLYTYFEIVPDQDLDSNFQKRKMFLNVYNRLLKVMTISIENKVNILTVTIRTPEPMISSNIANNLIKSLDSYVRTKRKSNATLQRDYIEERVSQVNDSLLEAENALQIFLSRNKVTDQSPQLNIDLSRLNRQIQIYQTIVIELTRQLEISRIDEIRDAPIINVQEWAGVPVIKAGPKRTLYAIFASLFILLITLIYFLFYDHIRTYVKEFIIIKPN